MDPGIINYSDNLNGVTSQFTGSPGGISYFVTDGELRIAGNGTSAPNEALTHI